MALFKRMNSARDVASMAVMNFGEVVDPVAEELALMLSIACEVFTDREDAIESLNQNPFDLLLVGPAHREAARKKQDFCRDLRHGGYSGIVTLIARDTTTEGGSDAITGAGFDSVLLASDKGPRLIEAVNWAVINRKRRNKYTIQFDNNPDACFTIDATGRIFDVNIAGLTGSRLAPREVVVDGVKIGDLGTLPCFERLIRPLICEQNIGRTFNHVVEEQFRIFQVRTRILNVRTLGLVATIIKTEITKTVSARTFDILVNSVTMLSQRDNYTAGHSARVYYYAKLIAEKMGLANELHVVRPLYLAALLHDIGKIGVRDNVLLKPGRLSEEEFQELRTHSAKGHGMLQHYDFLRDCLLCVRAHHERHDGTGYPDQLKGDQIPLGATIIAVADSFDAMTSNRPYRAAMSYDRALEELANCAGRQHRREISEAFLSAISRDALLQATALAERPLGTISEEIINTLLHE